MSGAPLTSIRNIGPAMAQEMQRAGFRDADHLRDLGADAAYARMIDTGTRPHFIGYYALVMGLHGRPWNDCQGDEKTRLRASFDALCAARKTPDNSAIEAELDKLGLGLRR
ncbi:TfoX/Sxy family DNA transformation protein [Pseudooceanicola atlanticus]|uniref:Competence protein TfoX n=1 Tax=Pseudooceanicola atlanticus TaxID=1461694 RepID=A0A0A0EEZ7_9RHOB|nr:TfoX/Sxy family DNA transformation protein [Pseudooceanicola atlanticus]KGM48673.1 competence protein TfoX [Pseudooceanicola atlanticus]